MMARLQGDVQRRKPFVFGNAFYEKPKLLFPSNKKKKTHHPVRFHRLNNFYIHISNIRMLY